MPACNRRTFLTVSGAILGGIATGTTVTAATRSDRYLVRTEGDASLDGFDVVYELPGVDLAAVQGSASELKRSNAVTSFAPDVEIELDEPSVNADAPTTEETSVTDEPYYPIQWDKQALDIPTAHETTKGEGTRVAILDSGVAAGHPDLDVNEDLSRNFTEDSLGAAVPAGGYHGTHVAGITAAQTDNETGVAGTAPETDLVDCRVFSTTGGASFASIFAAILYSADIGADVANLSLGAYPVPREAQGSFYGKALNSVLTYANREGTLLTIAAGNDAADLQHDGRVCADFDDDGEVECHPVLSLPNEGAQALSVSATGPIGFNWKEDSYGESEPAYAPALYTNYGTNAVDIAAPGGNYNLAAYAEANDGDDVNPEWYYDLVFNTIAEPSYETNEEGDVTDIEDVEYSYGWVAGTSMAAPQVAGAAALVKSANPDYSPNQVRSALERAAAVPDEYDRAYYGSGFLNVVDAL